MARQAEMMAGTGGEYLPVRESQTKGNSGPDHYEICGDAHETD